MDVNKLSTDLQSQLRSDLMARNVSNCVTELVENALDANAKNIAVRINLETFYLEVIDDGVGLTKDQLALVGERYFTSKNKNTRNVSNTAKPFGYRGEGLASIKNVSSNMMIVSRVQGEDTTYCKAFKGSSTEIGASHIDRPTHGTTVIVKNVLGNLPVRQKCTKTHAELQTIKWFIQAMALMFPMVNFSIRDNSKSLEILNIPRTNSTTATFRNIFSGAIKDRSSIVKVFSKHENITIKAMISKEICDTDRLQFIFVNKQYISSRNEIQKYLNQLLNRIDSSNEKNISHKAVYILNLSCPREIYDVILESDKRNIAFKDWGAVKKCLINLANQLINDESARIEDEKVPERKDKPIFLPEDAFHKLNTLNTVFGLPANRTEPQNETNNQEYVIDDESSSSESVSLLRKPKSIERLRSNVAKPRFQKNQKTSNETKRVPKNTKCHKGVSLAEQGIPLTYVKSPRKMTQTAAKKDQRTIEPNKSSENLNAIANEMESDEYAWVWKLPTKKGRNSDRNEGIGDEGKAGKTRGKQPNESKKPRREPTKGKKAQVNTNADHIERYKNITALSYQRMLKNPGHERISKKQNHYFDGDKANEADFIAKYGYPKKHPGHLDKPEENLRTSNLEAENTGDLNIFDKFISKGRNNDIKNIEPTASLPGEENEENGVPPGALIPTQIISQSEPSQLKNTVIQTKLDALDYKSKVSDWISKLPSNLDFEYDPNDEIQTATRDRNTTPTHQPRLTQEISDEFATKTKITETRDTDKDDLSLYHRTPEKSKSFRFDNFNVDGSLLKTSRSQRHELLNKNHQKRNTRVSRLLFKWSPKDISNRNVVDDIFKFDNKNVSKENQAHITFANDSQTTRHHGNDSKIAEDPMSWKCEDDKCAESVVENPPKSDDSNRKNEALSDIQNFTHSSQDSEKSCPNDCRCKCHNKLKKKISANLFDDDIKESDKEQQRALENLSDEIIVSENSLANDEAFSKLDHEALTRNNPFEPITNNEPEPEKLATNDEDAEPETVSQHFNGCENDSKYFLSKSELIEKSRFKQKYKFLESSSAIDIPKGMLEVQKSTVKIDKLTDDEKKVVGDLVKPYSMQKHITLDDYGNSCIRIFPFLKKGVEKLGNCEANKKTEDINCGITFTKEDISSFKFITQIEKQFILASATLQISQTSILILLDQHAVDERIRVERLQREYTDGGEWLSSPINPPINLSVPSSCSSLFTDYRSHLEEYGMYYEFNNATKNKQEKLLISVTKVPTCFYNRAMREKNNFQSVLKSLIESLMKEILKQFATKGTLVHATPTELQNVMNYEACRGAVKFGDKLTPQVCIALLEGLKSCNFPFQCAHGRPSVIPLVNLDKLKDFQKQVRKPTLDYFRNKLIKKTQI